MLGWRRRCGRRVAVAIAARQRSAQQSGSRRTAFNIFQQHHKLVVAETRCEIDVAGDRAQQFCNFDQQAIADQMAQSIVDRLKPIEVEKQERELRLGLAMHLF